MNVAVYAQTTWSSTVTYSNTATVAYAGASYVSIQPGNLNQNPATATAWWSPFTPAPWAVSGNLSGVGGVSGDLIQWKVQLVNCGSANPIIPNITNLVPTTKVFTGDSSGNFSGTLWGNESITCNGSASTLYQAITLRNNVPAGVPVFYRITGTFNLGTAVPVTLIPPTSPLASGILCPSGEVMAGLLNNLTPVCVTSPYTLPVATSSVLGGIKLNGDIGGVGTAPTVVGIQGSPVSATPPTTGQDLVWNGSAYVPTSATTQVNGTPLTSQNPKNFQDSTTVHFTNPSAGVITATASNGLQAAVVLPATCTPSAPCAILYPTTQGYVTGDVGTGSAIAGLSSALIVNGPGGGSLSSNTWGATWGGFTLPSYITGSTITHAWAFHISSLATNPSATFWVTSCTTSLGSVFLNPTTSPSYNAAGWGLQQFTQLLGTSWSALGAPTCQVTSSRSSSISPNSSTLTADSVGLIVQYTGAAPPTSTVVGVVPPLGYSAVLNQLSIDQSAIGGVTTFNTRVGAVTLTAADVNALGPLTNSTSGNAATATALAATPTLCSTGSAPTGVLANGNATGCATIGGGSGNTTSTSLTTNHLPKANGANSIIDSLESDTGTVFSIPQPASVNDGTGNGGIFDSTEATAPSAAAGHDMLYGDSTAHCMEYSANGGAFSCLPTGAGTGLNGTVTYTASHVAGSSDNGKLVIMNCSSACSITLPTTQPSTTWAAAVVSQGSTVATVALGGSDTYNGSTSVPVLVKNQSLWMWADSATSTAYQGQIPTVAGSNITITPASNGLTLAGSGSGSGAMVNITGLLTVTCSGACSQTSSAVTVTTASATINLAAIPQTYSDIRVIATVNTNDSGASNLYLQADNDTAAHYVSQSLFSAGSSAAGSASGLVAQAGFMPYPGTPGGAAGGLADFTIANYTNTTWQKRAVQLSSRWNSATADLAQMASWSWNQTPAITSLQIGDATGTVNVGSVFSIYGVQ